MKQSNVSIIIPAFNEEKAIGNVVKSIHSNFPESEIIVVNDGSTDNTVGEIEASTVIVLHHDHNCGYGASLKTGARNATRDYVLFCDGDGQHSVEDIRRLIIKCDGYDLVIGARNSLSHQPFLRRPGKFVMKKFAELLAGTKIPDLNSGLRIFKRDTLMHYLHLMPNGFSFSTTSTFAIMKANRKYKYIPIMVKNRIGKSTVNQLKHGPQSLLLILRLAVLFEPLKVFLTVSGILFVLSITSFVFDLCSTGGIADTTVLLSIGTIVIFMSGLLCDQVSAMRREKHE
ncbi:MAG: glycosyltransferase family 2 protein [Thermodesulfobacteriota bacterium]|nr:glycosyltransferase family 2 protein [Thermodesulfobacteriota bacterium]